METFKINDVESSTIFYAANGKEILKLYPSGKNYVNGKLIENDKEVVNELRKLLKLK